MTVKLNIDLVRRAEKRGYWLAVEAALYLSQIHGIVRHQAAVDNVWRSRQGEKEPLDAFIVEDFVPAVMMGVTPNSLDGWIENYMVRGSKNDPPRPAGCLTVADVAEQLHITRKEAYQLVYVQQAVPSEVFSEIKVNRWTFPLRCVRAEAISK